LNCWLTAWSSLTAPSRSATSSRPVPTASASHFVDCVRTIEEVFGWVKSAAGLRQTRHRGQDRVGWCFTLATTAYNLIRLPKLLHQAPA